MKPAIIAGGMWIGCNAAFLVWAWWRRDVMDRADIAHIDDCPTFLTTGECHCDVVRS